MNGKQAACYSDALFLGYAVIIKNISERSAEDNSALNKAIGYLAKLALEVEGDDGGFVCGHWLLFCRHRGSVEGLDVELEIARRAFEKVVDRFIALGKAWRLDAKTYGYIWASYAHALLKAHEKSRAIQIYQRICRSTRTQGDVDKTARDKLKLLDAEIIPRKISSASSAHEASHLEFIRLSEAEYELLSLTRDILEKGSFDFGSVAVHLELSKSYCIIGHQLKNALLQFLSFLQEHMILLEKVLKSDHSQEDKIIHILTILCAFKEGLPEHSSSKLKQFLWVEMFFSLLLPQIKDYFFKEGVGKCYLGRNLRSGEINFYCHNSDEFLEELTNFCQRLREELDMQLEWPKKTSVAKKVAAAKSTAPSSV